MRRDRVAGQEIRAERNVAFAATKEAVKAAVGAIRRAGRTKSMLYACETSSAVKQASRDAVAEIEKLVQAEGREAEPADLVVFAIGAACEVVFNRVPLCRKGESCSDCGGVIKLHKAKKRFYGGSSDAGAPEDLVNSVAGLIEQAIEQVASGPVAAVAAVPAETRELAEKLQQAIRRPVARQARGMPPLREAREWREKKPWRRRRSD